MGESASKLSIIIPVYRLSARVQDTIKALKRHLDIDKLDYEIIVVDDGSPDDTYEKALEAADKNVRVLHYRDNRGKGYALLHGFRHSSGDLVVFFDGDLDIPAQQVQLLIKALRNMDVDVAITSKWHKHSKIIATPMRKILSKFFNALVQISTGIRLSDTQTGAKIFKRKVLEETAPLLTIKRYAFDVELLVAVTAKGYKIAEIPSIRHIKLTGRFSFKEIVKMFVDLLAITYRHRVKKQYSRK